MGRLEKLITSQLSFNVETPIDLRAGKNKLVLLSVPLPCKSEFEYLTELLRSRTVGSKSVKSQVGNFNQTHSSEKEYPNMDLTTGLLISPSKHTTLMVQVLQSMQLFFLQIFLYYKRHALYFFIPFPSTLL